MFSLPRIATGIRRGIVPGFLALVLLAVPAAGDAIKTSGYWIEDVEIRSVSDGKMLYQTPTGAENEQALTQIEAVRLDEVPQLEKGRAELEKGNTEAAVELLREAQANTRRDWVKQFAGALIVRAFDQAGQPREATELYLQLLEQGAPPAFLADPPLTSVREAEQSVRQGLVEPIQQAAKNVDQPMADRLQKLLAAAQKGRASVTEEEKARQQAPGLKVVTIPSGLRDGPILQLIKMAKFEEAVKEANQQLKDGRGSNRELYLKGLAQLGMAEQAGDSEQKQKLYKDAGLSFMKVDVFFGHNNGPYVGPSLVEAGYVHDMIGRPDKAEALYQQAVALLDEEEDPEYYQHLQERRAARKGTAAGAGAGSPKRPGG